MPSKPERRADRPADAPERKVDELERRAGELEEKVIEVRRDWDRKRADPKVPGALPKDGDDSR